MLDWMFQAAYLHVYTYVLCWVHKCIHIDSSVYRKYIATTKMHLDAVKLSIERWTIHVLCDRQPVDVAELGGTLSFSVLFFYFS